MKNPLWIVTSALLSLLLVMLGYILISVSRGPGVPARTSLKTPLTVEPQKREAGKPQDIQFIYERDPFSTYRPAPIQEKPIEQVPTIPLPPAPKPLIPQQRPSLVFLEPLPIKITGIIYSSNEAKSQVTLINNNTKKTDTYKVGSKLFDAYVIRIFPKKIILIRSNGQQETIFMYPSDAQNEIKALQESSWTDVVGRQSETQFQVNPKAFITRIGNLAKFIEMLDATTAYREGESIGCRIGKMDTKSLGYALGLLPGDIIISVQGIKPSSTSNRITIYNTLAELTTGERVTVEVVRQGKSLIFEYTLFSLGEITKEPEVPQTQNIVQVTEDVQDQHYKKLERYSENKNVKKYDKYAMRNFGGSQAAIKSLHSTS